jgi:UrcA family protein
MQKLITLTAAALTAISFTTAASAADAGSPSRSVEVGDLSTPAGVAEFSRRVRYAAEAVCGDAPGYRSLAENLHISRCIKDALAIHSPEMQASTTASPNG